MLKALMQSWVRLVVGIPILLLALYGGWTLLSGWASSPGRMAPERRLWETLDENVAEQIARAIRHDPEAAELYVLPVAGDAADAFRGRLRKKIDERGITAVVQNPSEMAQLLGPNEKKPVEEGTFRAVLKRLTNPDPDHPPTRQEAVAFARRYDVPAVLLGEIQREDTPERARLTVKAQAVKVPGSAAEGPAAGVVDLLEKNTFEEDRSKSIFSPLFFQLTIRGYSGWARLLIWCAFTVVLPLVNYRWIQEVLRKESNASNAILLAGLTVVDLFLAWLLIGFAFGDAMAVGALTLAVVVGFVWNFFICDRMEELRR